jgi:hypothetical protein
MWTGLASWFRPNCFVGGSCCLPGRAACRLDIQITHKFAEQGSAIPANLLTMAFIERSLQEFPGAGQVQALMSRPNPHLRLRNHA